MTINSVCYFGDFDPEYARNRVIIKGLEENSLRVFICNTREKNFWAKIKTLRRQLCDLKGKYDLIIVGYSDSRTMMLLAKFWSKKPVVWDAFYSRYDSWVGDRRLVSPFSFKAIYYWLTDWLNCQLADRILLDTQEHIRYFQKTFGISFKRFVRLFVGTDPSYFHPRPTDNHSGFLVHFHGNYIPLQGTEYIIQAAALLKNKPIKFRMIGDGQTHDSAVALARELGVDNIEFLPKVSLAELPLRIAEADICLGIFGDTAKARRVIPNKVYESIAMSKPIISADTPAIRELFTDKVNIFLCRIADPESLANAIKELEQDAALRTKIAAGGFSLFQNQATPAIIVKELLSFLELIL